MQSRCFINSLINYSLIIIVFKKSNMNSKNNIRNHAKTAIPREQKQIEHKDSILSILDNYDKQLSDKIHKLEINDIFEFVLYLSARLYNPECVTCYFIIMFAYFAKVKHDYFFIVKPVLHVLIILLVTLISKHIIGRPRPNVRENVKRNFILRHKEKNCSMPSGDAMQSANFAVILIYYFNCYYGVLLIPFVMISRVYYFCHYVSDTVVGAFMGWIISYSLVVIFRDV